MNWPFFGLVCWGHSWGYWLNRNQFRQPFIYFACSPETFLNVLPIAWGFGIETWRGCLVSFLRSPFNFPRPRFKENSDHFSAPSLVGTQWARRDILSSRARQFLSLNCLAITLTAGVIWKREKRPLLWSRDSLGDILGDNLGEGNCESNNVSRQWGDNFLGNVLSATTTTESLIWWIIRCYI